MMKVQFLSVKRATKRATQAVNLETRQRAIAILEKLPEAMLDEAVKFLESLSVKANLVE
ncbi:hypothetical protein [Microcoleus sp. herbarium12]|jgi:hypothetical protein|uniref:hypothetical protein n=1 Tax=Microcoleus sp. herbarium12 TaxID=3055437 RepID=UPI002FD42279